jgi:hypothetical protein
MSSLLPLADILQHAKSNTSCTVTLEACKEKDIYRITQGGLTVSGIVLRVPKPVPTGLVNIRFRTFMNDVPMFNFSCVVGEERPAEQPPQQQIVNPPNPAETTPEEYFKFRPGCEPGTGSAPVKIGPVVTKPPKPPPKPFTSKGLKQLMMISLRDAPDPDHASVVTPTTVLREIRRPGLYNVLVRVCARLDKDLVCVDHLAWVVRVRAPFLQAEPGKTYLMECVSADVEPLSLQWVARSTLIEKPKQISIIHTEIRPIRSIVQLIDRHTDHLVSCRLFIIQRDGRHWALDSAGDSILFDSRRSFGGLIDFRIILVCTYDRGMKLVDSAITDCQPVTKEPMPDEWKPLMEDLDVVPLYEPLSSEGTSYATLERAFSLSRESSNYTQGIAALCLLIDLADSLRPLTVARLGCSNERHHLAPITNGKCLHGEPVLDPVCLWDMNVIVADHTGYLVVRVVGLEDLGKNLIGVGSVECLDMPVIQVVSRFRRLCTGRTVKLHVQIVPGRDNMVEFRVLRILPLPGSETFDDLRQALGTDGVIKCVCDEELIRLPDEVRERLKTAQF